MKPPFPSLTAEWHNDTYPAINPKRAELSLKGASVVITGGGTGIGKSTALAFAEAGAASIAILGRRSHMLDTTKQEIEGATGAKVTTHTVDVCDAAALKRAAEDIGVWNILVANAGYLAAREELATADADDWWKGFETTVKGTFNTIQAFTPTKASGAIFISTNTGAIQVSAEHTPGISAYVSAKMATLEMMKVLAAEQPDLHVVSTSPGIVATDMFKKAHGNAEGMDTVELAAHFTVWLCSEEAKFLRGRFLWVNWDVPQLLAKKAEFEADPLLTLPNALGWPYKP